MPSTFPPSSHAHPYQAQSAILSAIAALTLAANKYLGTNGSGQIALLDPPAGSTATPSHLPGEWMMYGGTLDSNNPALLATSYSGRLLNLKGELWVLEGSTIGSAASTATVKDAKAEGLFKAVWGRSDVTLSGGKGASSAADWTANKVLTLPTQAGRFPLAAGNGSGLSTRTQGDTGGSQDHVLTGDQTGPHTHAADGDFFLTRVSSGGAITSPSAGSLYALKATTASAGSGLPHNNMPPYWVAGTILWALGALA